MLPNNDQALYGAPVGNGMAVNPLFSQGARSGNASPSMSYEEGGAIPDDDDYSDDSTGALDVAEPDETTKAVSDALNTVNSVLMYGRQKHGLPSDEEGGGEEMAFEDGGAIPDDEEFNDAAPEGGAEPVWQGEKTFGEPIYRDAAPEGGAIPEEELAEPAKEDMSGVTAPTDDASLNKPQDMAPVPDSQNKQPTPLQYLMGTEAIDAAKGDQVMKMAGNDAAKAIDLMVRGEDGNNKAPDWGAGWAMAQYNRRKYDLYMNHGRAAVDKDDYQNAANSIMKAFENVPDGQTVQAKPMQSGVALTVSDAGGKPTASAQLDKAQLAELTNTGKAGQFDAVLQAGVPKVLQQFERGTGYIGRGGLDKVNAGAGVASAPSSAPTQPQVGFDREATRDLDAPGGTDMYPRGKRGAFYRDVTNINTPSYDAYRMRKGDVPIIDKDGYKTGWRTNTANADRPQGRVSVHQGDNVRQYQNGVDVTPDREQANKLEQIRARNEGRGINGDKQLERERLRQDRMDTRAEKSSERQAARDKAISERREKSGSLSADRAQRALEYRVAGERLKLKREGFKDEDIDKMIAATYGKSQQAAPPAAAPQGPVSPQPRQPSPQDQAAIDWARSNPNDPRAQKILRLNGVQ